MNHEFEVMNRVVDYHDHIYAPPAPLTDDLHRGRRRVRRNRGMLASGLALGVASVVAAASLFTGGGLADRTQPAGPPTTDTTSDPADNVPLVAPESLLDVTELGFHVEAVPDVVPIEDWSLAPDYQATTVTWADQELAVRVYYPGKEPEWHVNLEDGQLEAVSVHGVTGTYFERYGGSAGGWDSQLIWEYAPGSWAAVIGWGDSKPPQATIRPAFVSIAEAVRSGGGATTRLPFRVGTAGGPHLAPMIKPSYLEDPGVSLTPLGADTDDGFVSSYGVQTIGLYENGTWCDAEADEYGYNGSTVEPFTYRGHKGCIHIRNGEFEEHLAVVLRVGAVDRVYSDYPQGDRLADREAEMKEILAELEVAQLDDPSTWFDLKSALGS